MKVKQFILMAGHIYYASGGFHDYKGSFDTKKEAEDKEREWLQNKEYVWSHICDLETSMLYGKGSGCNPMSILGD